MLRTGPLLGLAAVCVFGCSKDQDDTGPPGWEAPTDAVDPGPPSFDEEIQHIGLSLRTGSGATDATSNNSISFCLSEANCWPLDLLDVEDFRKGGVDHYTLDPSGLARSDISFVGLLSEDGSDAFRPDCMQVSINGEMVYCQDDLDFLMGNGDGELEAWWDPDGLHRSCRSCWDDALTHGPVQGAPRHDGADIWIRTDVTRSVRLELEHPQSESKWIADWSYPGPDADFSQVLQAQGLEPNTDYSYSIHLEGGETAGPFGLKTAPSPGDSGQFDVAFGSCSKFDLQPAFKAIRDSHPDLFLFLGDNHYGNTSDRDSLRWFYQWAHGREFRKELLADIPILATWDDHDYTGNNTDGLADGKEIALQAFEDYWPNPSAGTADTPGTFFTAPLGDIDFFLLDVRYYRGLDGGMLGEEQTEWLKERLLASDATFKVLAGGSQWTEYGSSDSWKSFLEARDSLFAFIWENRINGVVLISGDIHRSSFRTISVEGGGYALPELTSSPLSNTTTSCKDDEEVLACYNSRPSYVNLHFDTSLSDPLLRASLRNDSGEEQHAWEVRLSELSVP